MINEYLQQLQETSMPTKWRQRVEVYILKDDKLVVGYNKNKNLYIPPGGGVEKGQTLYTAAETEALEEIGVQIKNPTLIVKDPFLIDWYELEKKGVILDDKIKGRMDTLRGQKIYFMKAEFDKVNMKYYGKGGDSMKPVIMTKERFIIELKKQDKWLVTKHRIKLIGML